MSGLYEYIYNSIYGEDKPMRTYGWKKGETYDKTEKFTFSVPNDNLNHIKQVDLRDKCPEVYDQGKLGSCTANAIGFCYEFDEMKQNEKEPFIPSRLFIYYNERNMEGHTKEDAGAEIHDGIKSIHLTGVCPETEWPYNIEKFTEKPSPECYETAKNHKTLNYRAIDQTIDQIKAALTSGFPVVFGFVVYSSFESQEVAETGRMPMPKEDEDILGGHAIAAVGFDDKEQVFIIRNSWSSAWGDNGYFYMPYDFIKNPEYASDFWVVTKTNDLNTKVTINNHLKSKKLYDKILTIKTEMAEEKVETRHPSPYLIPPPKNNKKNKKRHLIR